MISGIVDRDERGGLSDSIFETLHGSIVLLLPCKGCAFSGEVNEWSGDRGIALDPDAHVTGGAKECTDIGEILARGPVSDLVDLGVIGNAAVVIALVSEDDYFGDCYEQLLGRNCGSGASEAVEDAVYIVKVLPDEAAHLIVLGDCLESAVVGLVASRRPFDAAVVHKGPRDIGDLRLEDKGDVFVKDGTSIGPSLWQTCQSHGSDRGLNSGQIARGDIKGAMVISNEEVEH